MIRALRLRFGWHHRVNGFIRISGEGPFLVECHPPGLIPFQGRRGRRPQIGYWIWWRDSSLIDGIKPLQGVVRINKPFSFYINDQGDYVTRTNE